MPRPQPKGEIVFDTPWFKVRAQAARDGGSPNYIIQSPDFSMIVAADAQGRLLLVRQFRHGQDMVTLEFPAGHVDEGETPEQSARKELCEETGYEADHFELIGNVAPSTARFTNRLWIFFAADVRPAMNPQHAREAGVTHLFWDKGIRALLEEEGFIGAPGYAALFAAIAKGRLKL